MKHITFEKETTTGAAKQTDTWNIWKYKSCPSCDQGLEVGKSHSCVSYFFPSYLEENAEKTDVLERIAKSLEVIVSKLA